MQPTTANSPADASAPAARKWVLDPGFLLESGPDPDRMALWMRAGDEGGFRYWERISGLPHTEFMVAPGVRAIAGTLVRARQRARGLFGRLLGRPVDNQWVLPNGERAEEWGARQNDLLLVWSGDQTGSLDEAWIESRWPGSTRRQRLGENFYLVAGVQPPNPDAEAQRSSACPHATAEKHLSSARTSADAHREALAQADLGASYLHEGYAQHAVAALEEALRLANRVGDQSLQSEVLSNLGLTLSAGNPRQALEIFAQALAIARAARDRFAEKTALERVGLGHARLNEHFQAIQAFGQALELARAVGHRKHQCDLLWYIAIQYAELGQRDEAVRHAQSAIDLMKKMSNPKAAWYAALLQKYCAGESGIALGGTEGSGPAGLQEALLGDGPMANLWAAGPGSRAAEGPGLLRMAVSATKSMAGFIGSGFKTAPPRIVQHRLRTCAACEHHTGLRCRLCGCFTNAKAPLAHEECPIGKWVQ